MRPLHFQTHKIVREGSASLCRSWIGRSLPSQWCLDFSRILWQWHRVLVWHKQNMAGTRFHLPIQLHRHPHLTLSEPVTVNRLQNWTNSRLMTRILLGVNVPSLIVASVTNDEIYILSISMYVCNKIQAISHYRGLRICNSFLSLNAARCSFRLKSSKRRSTLND